MQGNNTQRCLPVPAAELLGVSWSGWETLPLEPRLWAELPFHWALNGLLLNQNSVWKIQFIHRTGNPLSSLGQTEAQHLVRSAKQRDKAQGGARDFNLPLAEKPRIRFLLKPRPSQYLFHYWQRKCHPHLVFQISSFIFISEKNYWVWKYYFAIVLHQEHLG